MKTKFSTLDILAIVPDLKSKICTGWRVNQVYDCDNKTYLFKLNKSIVQMKKDDDPLDVDEETANKMSFIIKSGMYICTTDYDWPKSPRPNSFAIKLRNHIRNKRVEDITQLGIDRLIDIKFGSNQAANHLIVELYDRGNLILTDYNYTIICILRWRGLSKSAAQTAQTDEQAESDNLSVGDTYPVDLIRQNKDLESMTETKIIEILNNSRVLSGSKQNYKKRNRAKQNQDDSCVEIDLKDLFNPYVVYGSSLLEDRLFAHLFKDDQKPKKCSIRISVTDSLGRLNQDEVKQYATSIKAALDEAELILQEVKSRKKSLGYVVQRRHDSLVVDETSKPSDTKSKALAKNNDLKSHVTNLDYFPILSCAQRMIDREANNLTYEEFESFDKAVDVYYSNLEGQKLDNKTLVAEREAMKKLDNLRIAQEKRLDDLARVQKEDEEKARLIELNCDKVENALLIIRSMLANQMPWSDIRATIKEAQAMDDPIASLITQVKFDRNEFTMKLSDPWDDERNDDQRDDAEDIGAMTKKQNQQKAGSNARFKNVDIDIGLSAYANARRFFTKRRTAVNKEKKTIEVSKKAFKNVERQTKAKLKEVVVKTNITRARKRYWFENFLWFISSDGYLVVAGGDAGQNEMLVKRYMKNNDIYVHGDLHGAATVIIKNELPQPVPPKTLVEAGSMAVCCSSAWDSKIAATSWWVYPKQVSKTAPSGEYLTQGAFIIRGKKNFLPLSNLVLGFGILFRLDDESIGRRKNTRLTRERNASESTLSESNQDGKTSHEKLEPRPGDESGREEEEAGDEEIGGDSESGEESSENSDETEDEVQSMEAKPEDRARNGSANANKHPSRDQQLSAGRSSSNTAMPSDLIQQPVVVEPSDKQQEASTEQEASDLQAEELNLEEDEDEYDEEGDKLVEHRLIDTITENPLADDVLLYSIPMCGPYSAFQNFKYKVKLVPGTNKRGKAAKSCLGLFLHDKRASQRERDLLRALKDQDYARNIPNKVKVSSANMKTITKKRPKKSEVRLPAR